MNSFLLEFIKKSEDRAKTITPPNPTKNKNVLPTSNKQKSSSSFAEIVEDKPPAKQVLEYLKTRINEIYEDSEDA